MSTATVPTIALEVPVATSDIRDRAPFRIPRRPTERQLVAKYFRTFGDATRLHILDLLADGELSVSEIVEQVNTSQPRISAHLACLRWCGLVATRRQHRTVYYRLADERAQTMLKLARDMLADNAEHVAACQTIDGCSLPRTKHHPAASTIV
ncbi:MAG: ArsR/SmtB family transcription factor [Solirubrobacteraceae bacterium]